jgi:hypothetical protein
MFRPVSEWVELQNCDPVCNLDAKSFLKKYIFNSIAYKFTLHSSCNFRQQMSNCVTFSWLRSLLRVPANDSGQTCAQLRGVRIQSAYSRFVPNLTRQDGCAFAGLINSGNAGVPAATALTPQQVRAMDAKRRPLQSH